MTKHFFISFHYVPMTCWNWWIEYVIFDYTIDKYGLVTTVIILKYLYSFLPCTKRTNQNKTLQTQIKVCESCIDSKNYERFVWKIEKTVNAIISTYLCI